MDRYKKHVHFLYILELKKINISPSLLHIYLSTSLSLSLSLSLSPSPLLYPTLKSARS